MYRHRRITERFGFEEAALHIIKSLVEEADKKIQRASVRRTLADRHTHYTACIHLNICLLLLLSSDSSVCVTLWECVPFFFCLSVCALCVRLSLLSPVSESLSAAAAGSDSKISSCCSNGSSIRVFLMSLAAANCRYSRGAAAAAAGH